MRKGVSMGEDRGDIGAVYQVLLEKGWLLERLLLG